MFKKKMLVFATLCMSAFFIFGCGSNKEVKPITSTQNETEDANTKHLILSVVNLTNVDIGMFSVMDPSTNEQVDLGALAPSESYSMECNWPVDTDSFQWALYNTSGELCMEATTDISSAKEGAMLVLKGDTSVDSVEALFDDEIKNQ